MSILGALATVNRLGFPWTRKRSFFAGRNSLVENNSLSKIQNAKYEKEKTFSPGS